MRRFRPGTVARHLQQAFGALLAALALVGVLGVVGLVAAHRVMHRVTEPGASAPTIQDDVRDVERLTWLVGVAVVTCVVLGAVAAWWLWRRLRRDLLGPLEEMRDTLRRAEVRESGEVDARLEPRGVEEVQAVTRALNDMAAEAAHLAAEQRQHLARAQQTAVAGRLVRSSLDLSDVLTAAAEAIGLIAEVDRVAVRADDTGGGRTRSGIWSAAGVAPLSDGPPSGVLSPAAAQALRSGHPVEVRPGGSVTPEGRAWLEREGIVRATAVPVLAGGGLVATAFLQCLDERPTLTPSESEAVEAVCREVGVAVGHSRLYESQRRLVEELRALDEAESHFVTTVSHELRTPLTNITGYLELLQDGDLGEISAAQQRALDVMWRNAARLLALTDDLLALARIDAGRIESGAVDLDITAVVRGALSRLVPEARDRKLQLVTHVDDRLPQVRGDAAQLERVVTNLVSNAIKFTPEGGRITVALRRRSDGVELAVADTGIGIPAPELDRVFSRFFRSSTATARAIPGTGLGLVIVKSVVESHGGSVSVTSRVDEGTTFLVHLPATADPPTDHAAPDATTAAEAASGPEPPPGTPATNGAGRPRPSTPTEGGSP